MSFPNIYKNPIPRSVQNGIDMMDKRQEILKRFNPIPPQFTVFKDIIDRLPINHFKGFTWQKNGKPLIEIVENFRELQRQFKEEIKGQIENSVIILDRYENFIKEKTGVKPYVTGFFRFIYVKYGNDKISFIELSNDDIIFNIVEFCELEKIRINSFLDSRKKNGVLIVNNAQPKKEREKKQKLTFEDIFVNSQTMDKAIKSMIELRMINSEFIYLMGGERVFIRSFVLACRNMGFMKIDESVTQTIKAVTMKLGLGELRINIDKKAQIVKIEEVLIK